MDPRFAYQAHMPRHGDPNYNRLPHNFNMQVYINNYTFVNLTIFKEVFTKLPLYCVCSLMEFYN